MSSSAPYLIRIGSTGDTSGIDKMTGALGRADKAADEFIASIKAGVGIDIGGRIVNSLSQIPAVLQNAIARGVEFNNVLEGTQAAIAASMEKFRGLSREQALAESAAALEELKRQAKESPATITQLSEAWTATTGAMSAAGIETNKQIDLTVRLSQAVTRLNLPTEQLVQEMRALVTGNISLDAALAKTLGITNEHVAAAKAQGNLSQHVDVRSLRSRGHKKHHQAGQYRRRLRQPPGHLQ